MRIAVTFDTPYDGWEHPDHERQMATEVAAWKHDEPEMEYQLADALRRRGHEVYLLGVRDDLEYLTAAASASSSRTWSSTPSRPSTGTPPSNTWFRECWRQKGIATRARPRSRLLVSRNKAMSKKVLAYHGVRMPGFVTYRPGQKATRAPDLRFPLIVKPLQADASEGIAQASVVEDAAALGERVAMMHDRFDQPAIAEEFVEGRELYVSVLGNAGALTILPITEMVFDKRRTRPEERIATQSAKWDESYRERKGIRNVFARPLAVRVRKRIEEVCHRAFRALWLRDYARLDVRVGADGEVWFLEANANPFISYGHDMANAAHKAGMDYYEFIQRLVDEAMGAMARSKRRERAPTPELRCICGHELTATGRTAPTARAPSSGATPST